MKNNLLLIGILFILCSCSSLKVTTDHEKGTDFSSYDNFSIVEVEADQTGISDIDLRRIHNAVKNEMMSKGLKEMKGSNLEIHVHGIVQDKVSTDYDTEYYGYGMYRRRFGYGTAVTTVDITEYKEGSLIIDLVDASKDQLVWQGIGTARLKEDPKGREDRINKAVAKILEDYPPTK